MSSLEYVSFGISQMQRIRLIVAKVPHAQANSWPLLVLSGASETHNANKMAFQELDSIPLMRPYAKFAGRPPTPDAIPKFIKDAYRSALFGRPGPSFIDLPANLIMGTFDVERQMLPLLEQPPLSVAPEKKIQDVVNAIKSAKAPLVVIGKGVAYARAEEPIRALVEK